MRNWFFKNLGDGMLASEPLLHLEEFLLAVYENAGNPKEMAAFIRHESGALHSPLRGQSLLLARIGCRGERG